jgi:hypothetical protein
MQPSTSNGTGAIVRTTGAKLTTPDIGAATATSITTAALSVTALSDGKIPYHASDASGLADGPTKTDVDSAVSLKHAAVTIDGTSPLSLSTQAISLKNDAAEAITEVDTGALADSDTVVPTSKAIKDALIQANVTGLKTSDGPTFDHAHMTNGLLERDRSVAMGEWINVAYSAGNFTAGTGTWTVEEEDQLTLKYTLIGKTAILVLTLVNTTVSDITAYLAVALPFTSTGTIVGSLCRIIENGVQKSGFPYMSASGSKLYIYILGASFAAAGADKTTIQLTFITEIT